MQLCSHTSIVAYLQYSFVQLHLQAATTKDGQTRNKQTAIINRAIKRDTMGGLVLDESHPMFTEMHAKSKTKYIDEKASGQHVKHHDLHL